MATDGRLVKMEVDYSDIVDKRLPEIGEMAKVRSVFANLYLVFYGHAFGKVNGVITPAYTRTSDFLGKIVVHS